MVRLHGITRFNLVTPDLDRLVAFYRDVLQFAPLGATQTIEPSEIALLGLQGEGRRQLFAVGEQRLSIDQFSPSGRPYPSQGDAASLWFQHFALVVDDIAIAYAQLHDADPISVGGPQHLPASSGGVWAFKFRDPDGHPLEFLQGQESMVRGIDHSAISVADVNASTAFYRDLGLEPGARTLNQGPEQERLDGLPAVQVDVAPMIPQEPAPHLELLGYRTPRGGRGPSRQANDAAATRIVWRGSVAGLLHDPDGHLHQVEPAEPP
jgi:catechol 2,3-dioxygenase-like lactoylglutathione lyase family enzyme